MTYIQFYIAAILFFWLLERLIPARPHQAAFRDQWFNDLVYLIMNGHYAGYWLSILAGIIYSSIGFQESSLNLGWLTGAPIWAQLIIGLLVKDFFSWCVHNLLHRIPFLWQFHRLHHSAEHMDFMVVMRFHWMEIIVYRFFLFVPLALIGMHPDAFLGVIFIDVFWGFFNHANIKVDIGPFKYLFNSPKMHLWHHEYTTDRMNQNFGITLSVWDWMFGTVYWPEGEPDRLSFVGISRYPKQVYSQYLLEPFRNLVQRILNRSV